LLPQVIRTRPEARRVNCSGKFFPETGNFNARFRGTGIDLPAVVGQRSDRASHAFANRNCSCKHTRDRSFDGSCCR
jgi:hypothetical protein